MLRTAGARKFQGLRKGSLSLTSPVKWSAIINLVPANVDLISLIISPHPYIYFLL